MTTSMAGGRNRPDPTHLTDRQQFSQALTELRERSGLTIRDVASSTGIPPATVGDYFAGRSLPPTRMRWVLDEILRQCGITDQAAVDDWQCTLSRLRRRSAADVDEPYRGLAPFESRHARHFHGRDSIIRELLARSRDPIQVLAESSGAGLSSLLRAGVLAGARRHDRWLPIGLAPGRNPCRELADQLCATLGLPTDPVDHAVHARPDLLPDLVRRALPTAHTRLVLVVDHHDDSVAFQRAINILGSHPVAGLVCGARSAGSGAVVRLPPMTADELHAVITGPALDVGVRMTTEVVDLIMRDLADRPVELALLSQLLLRLWRSRTRSGIGTAQYRASGGLPGVAARLSATTRPTVPPEQRPTADTLVGRLAAVPSDGVLPRRTLVSGMAEPMADAVLTRLVAARVITTVGTSVRLSHPGIATGWRSAKQLRHERDNGDDHMDLHDQHLLP